jgi:hypothetical protein
VNDNRLDDAALLAALRAAVGARAAVPAAFVEAAKSAYAWHGIDAELASLSYDSLQDAGRDSGVRSESASVRALTFQSEHFSIEVEVTDDALFGQLVPPQPGTVELQTLAGETAGGAIDEVGCFSIEPKPSGQFRIRFRADGQPEVITGWLTLLIAG